MSIDNIILKECYDILAKRRQKAKVLADEHYNEICYKIPEIKNLKQTLSNTWIELSKSILQNQNNINHEIEKIKTSNLYAQQKIKSLLLENNYPENYIDTNYNCLKCKDSGHFNSEYCDCLKKLIQQKATTKLNNISSLCLSSFNNFDLNYYDNNIIEKYGISPKFHMEKILNFCKSYSDKFNDLTSQNILMLGQTGLGKTHLSLSIANEVLNKGFNVIYSSVGDIFRKIEKEHFNKNINNDDTVNNILNVDLLILDDLGSEFESQFYVSVLYNIINSRLNCNKPTIITTNCSLKEIESRYSPKILSRLMSCYSILNFVGKDIRQIKSINKKG